MLHCQMIFVMSAINKIRNTFDKRAGVLGLAHPQHRFWQRVLLKGGSGVAATCGLVPLPKAPVQPSICPHCGAVRYTDDASGAARRLSCIVVQKGT
jgi:hypothetical protein